MATCIGENYYNIMTRKLKMKDHTEKMYKNLKNATNTLKKTSIEVN